MHTATAELLEPADTASLDCPVTGELVAGRYRLRAPLGTGASSTVWLAHDERLRRAVALKELPWERQPFPGAAEHEAGAAARLSSANTVKVYDFVTDRSTATDWIAMEALSGRDLASVIRSDAGVSIEETRYIGSHLLAALDGVHDAGLVHRDVKPSNVHLCRDGRVVLTDFGLATTPCTTGGAMSAYVVGSLPYIAPEIFAHGRYSPASDLYALGVTLYAAVTGAVVAVTGDDIVRGGGARLDLEALPRHAGALRPLLEGLLERDPVRRFDTVAAGRHLR